MKAKRVATGIASISFATTSHRSAAATVAASRISVTSPADALVHRVIQSFLNCKGNHLQIAMVMVIA